MPRAYLLRLRQVRIGDDAQPAADELVVHLALVLERLLLAIRLGQSALHLAEAPVVQAGGIHVNAGHGGLAQCRQPGGLGDAAVGMIGGIRRSQDGPVRRALPCRVQPARGARR